MSYDSVHAEQERMRCACRSLDARACIRARYPGHYHEAWDEDADPYEDEERCECSCHDAEHDDEGP